MGKAKRWLRGLLGAKKLPDSTAASRGSDSRLGNAKEWALLRSPDGNDSNNGGTGGSFTEASSSSPYVEAVDTNKHAIAVAAATAAVAEAALAAAKAAAEVVRLTSGGSRYAAAYISCGSNRRRELAAVKIQSAFRSYLARRALRALKGLVKLQALVRGYIVRKQSTNILLRMQAMARIQARASANRTYMSESPHSSSKSSQSYQPAGVATPKMFDHRLRAYKTKLDGSALKKFGSKTNIKDHFGLMNMHLDSNLFDRWMEENSWNSQRDKGHAGEEKSYKILEVDTWKPHLDPRKSNHTEQSFTPFECPSRHSIRPQKSNSGVAASKVSTLRSLKFPQDVNQAAVWTAENSQLIYTSSRPESSNIRGPFSPARSECSRSLFRDHLGYPNYMVNTESSWAKFRSQSTPRQRMQFEQLGSAKRFVGGFSDAETNLERGATLHTNFRIKG